MNREDDNENYGIENTIKIVSAESDRTPTAKVSGTITMKITTPPLIKVKGFNIRKLLSFNKAKSRE